MIAAFPADILPPAASVHPWLPEGKEVREEPPRTRAGIEAAIAKMRPYWHSPIDFGHGLVMKGKLSQRRFRRRLRIMKMPEDLRGKRVLDVGTWDGFFSWEMERRGAGQDGGENFAIDHFCDKALEQFLFVRKLRGSGIRYKRMDVHDLTAEGEGEFDFIFFAGVLYHCRHPLIVLEKLRKVCRGQLLLETVCMLPAFHNDFPMIAFFPGDGAAGKSKRKWGISGAATIPWLTEALYSAGFREVKVVYRPSCSLLKRLVSLITGKPQAGRVVIHAFV